MKRVFVDGDLKLERQVKLACDFKYSWQLSGHNISVVPLAKSAIDAFCDFDLHIDGLPFKAYRRSPGANQEQRCLTDEMAHRPGGRIFAGESLIRSSGKSFGGSKTRYVWHVWFDDQNYKIEFANSLTSGMKRVYVNDRLEHEHVAMLSTDFQYSWRLAGHALCIVPTDARSAVDTFCSFDFQIDGVSFQEYINAQKTHQNIEPGRQRARSVDSRGASHTRESQSVNTRRSSERKRAGSCKLRTGQAVDDDEWNNDSRCGLLQDFREEQQLATRASRSSSGDQCDAQPGQGLPTKVSQCDPWGPWAPGGGQPAAVAVQAGAPQDPWASLVAPAPVYNEAAPTGPSSESMWSPASASARDPWASVAASGGPPSAGPIPWDPWAPSNAPAAYVGAAAGVPKDPWQACW